MLSYLFVYGTLLKAIQHPLYQEVVARAQYLGRVSFQGELYALEKFVTFISIGKGFFPFTANAQST
ncbi:MAG: hypothetical protein RL368_1498 [Pseudomonadota bacterium]|jgi:gamma-glutamylcyclotransferase (GGCT)/AIG2-like uncharacterized protein YtfP